MTRIKDKISDLLNPVTRAYTPADYECGLHPHELAEYCPFCGLRIEDCRAYMCRDRKYLNDLLTTPRPWLGNGKLDG